MWSSGQCVCTAVVPLDISVSYRQGWFELQRAHATAGEVLLRVEIAERATPDDISIDIDTPALAAAVSAVQLTALPPHVSTGSYDPYIVLCCGLESFASPVSCNVARNDWRPDDATYTFGKGVRA